MTDKQIENLERRISNFYLKLAEVYVFGLACSNCSLNGKQICSQNIDACAKRLKIIMGEIMNDR